MSKLDEEKISLLQNKLEDLEYGSIVITVHDGTITQIDTTEKTRFKKYSPKKNAHI